MAESTVMSAARDGGNTPPLTKPPAQQSPIARKSVTQPYSMDVKPEMKAIYDNIRIETENHYLVGLNPTRFLEEFLPWNASTGNGYKDKLPSRARLENLRKVPLKQGEKEQDMYGPFVNAFDKWVTRAALKAAGVANPETLRFLRTEFPDTACGGLNPDVSTYWNRDLTDRTNFSRHQTHEEVKPDIGHDAFRHELDERSGGTVDKPEGEASSDEGADDEGSDDENADNHWDDVDEYNDQSEVEDDMNEEGEDEDDSDDHLNSEGPQQEESDQHEVHEEELVAIEAEAETNAKLSPSSNVETDTELGNHTRGQIAAYAGLALSMAFRKHFFSMLILGRYARFIRWDRRGAIVTHRFDYVKNPMLMFHFYLRYGQLTPIQRGFDPTVKLCKNPLPESVRNAFERYHRSAWYGGTKFKRGSVALSFDDFYSMKVTDSKDGRTETFFVPPPQYRRASLFPFCRATRRSLACFYRKGVRTTMCFLKDSWQVESSRTEREADIYRRLKEAKVKHVASMRLGGDVKDLETVTQDWVKELSPNLPKLRGRMVCHRIILDTVARDLSTFSWCKVLLSCIADAVEALQDAYKIGILHRDLSAGNIMIVKDKETKEWRGVLIDWDMCLLWQKPGGKPRHGRTGTWAFISTSLLSHPHSASHTLWDDLESAFWVLLYEVLHYTSHSHESGVSHLLYDLVERIFGYCIIGEDGRAIGGVGKRNLLSDCDRGHTARNLTKFVKPGINELINDLGKSFYGALYDIKLRLDDPDNNWFPDRLRRAAKEMDPHCITPIGLKSPTNDSNPPKDPKEWQAASVKDSHTDYFYMQWQTHPHKPITIQKRLESRMVSSQVHGMDGSCPSGTKRGHISEPEDDYDQLQPFLKRQR